jgi:two-component system, chemotaxis family, sensor kinase CheA
MNPADPPLDYLIDKFSEETGDLLENAHSLSLTLLGSTQQYHDVAELFRIIHSVKGNAALLGFMPMKLLCHDLENLLDMCRKDPQRITKISADLIYKTISFLKASVERFTARKEMILDEQALECLRSEIAQCHASAAAPDQNDLWRQLVLKTDSFAKQYVGDDPQRLQYWDEIMKVLHAIKSDLGEKNILEEKALTEHKQSDPKRELLDFLATCDGESPDEEHCAELMRLLKELAEHATPGTQPIVREILDDCRSIIADDGLDSFLCELITEKIAAVEIDTRKKTVPLFYPDDLKSDLQEEKTIRVKKQNIDNLLSPLSELVIVTELFVHIQRRLEKIDMITDDVMAIKKNNELLSQVTTSLQAEIAEMRKVPVTALAQKAHHVALNIAATLGKKIAVTIDGSSVNVDKDIFECLQDPIVHIIRNCVDHGLESPEERLASGKSECGNLTVVFAEGTEAITIEIKDDGRGIDPDQVVRSAISKGFISDDEAGLLSDDEKLKLLFIPGFSTSKEVTEVSGRGVGLDVVRKNMTRIGGEIRLHSVCGTETVFCFVIPKKAFIKIVEGFLVSSGEYICVLPMEKVGESFQVIPANLTQLLEGKECLTHHGAVYEVKRLSCELGRQDDAAERKETIGVILDNGKNKEILLVDTVLGTQQVVVKDARGLSLSSPLVCGFAILGNEQIASVLDVDYLFQTKGKNIYAEQI